MGTDAAPKYREVDEDVFVDYVEKFKFTSSVSLVRKPITHTFFANKGGRIIGQVVLDFGPCVMGFEPTHRYFIEDK